MIAQAEWTRFLLTLVGVSTVALLLTAVAVVATAIVFQVARRRRSNGSPSHTLRRVGTGAP